MSTVKEPEKTAAELEAEAAAVPADKETAAAFVAELIDGTPTKKDEKKEPKPEKPAKPEPTEKAVEQPKPAPKPRKPKPEPREPDYEAIADAAGRGVAKALHKEPPKEEPKPEPRPQFTHLPPDVQRQLTVLQKMETMYPDRYKDITNKYATNVKAVSDYQEKWEKENPGEKYDEKDEEHNAFFEKHDVDWDDDDYTMALAEMVADRRVKDIEERTGKQLSELEQRDRARELWPKVFAEAKRVGKQVFNQLGGVFKDIIDDTGQVNRAVVQKISDEDPVGYEVALPVVTQLENRAALNCQLFDQLVKYDPKNAEHRFISDFALASEKEMLALPREKQVNSEGQKFATSEQYHRMNELERSKHYTFTAQNLNDMLAAETAARLTRTLKGERDKLRERAVRYGYLKPDSTNGQGKPGDHPEVEEEPEITEKPRQVSAGTEVLTPPTVRGRDHQPQNPGSAMLKELMG